MKVIISHDVDHLSWGEHWCCDMYIPRYLLRHTRYWSRRSISSALWWERVSSPFKGEPFNHLDELLAMDREYGVPGTYFIGMRNGLGMTYGYEAAQAVVGRLTKAGVAVGVHGIAYDSAVKMREEREALEAMLPADTPIGVRNHYLRRNETTLTLQADAGYQYDSSEEAIRSPYKAHGIIEFPVCLMEVRLLREDESPGLERAKIETEKMLLAAERAGLSHFTILFHDSYFSPLFPQHQAWYAWLIPWLQQRFEWSDFNQACHLLTNESSPLT